MSIMDLKLELSDDQAITAASTASTWIASTNTIDLGAESLAIGAGTPLYLNIRVGSAAINPTASMTVSTCQFRLSQGASSAATGSTVIETPAIQCLGLTAGKWVLRVAIPQELTNRYLKLLYIKSARTKFTSGKVDAWISAATPDTDVGT